MSVFISHATEDRTIAARVCSALELAKARCWMAVRNIPPGASYAECIVEAIEQADALVVIVSASSIESPHVLREVEQAVSSGKPILPFKIDEAKPGKALQYFLSTSQWLDAVTPPLEKHIDRLVNAISEMPALKALSSDKETRGVSGEPAPNLNPSLASGLTLRVESGPDAGLLFPLQNSRIVVGRATVCDVQLHEPAMSRNHFGLNWVASARHFVLVDFKAVNPVLVNGEVVSGEPRRVTPGDRITVGQTVMIMGTSAVGDPPRHG